MNRAKTKRDVFFSYDSSDRAQVEEIARQLIEIGIDVFLDRSYLTPGLNWHEELEQILHECRAVAVFHGPNGLGYWQKKEQYLALERQKSEQNFPVIPVLLPGADSDWGFQFSNTWIDLREDPHNPETPTVFAKAIQGKPVDPNLPKNRIGTCPYRGLHVFRERDEPLFFGREAFVKKLITMVQNHSFVGVIGPSGSGKSSVVRAGLVPRLRRGETGQMWDVFIMVPGESPLRSLASVMLRLLDPELTDISHQEKIADWEDLLTAGKLRLKDVVKTALEKQPGTDRLLLVVDQFEELYASTQNEQAQQKFIGELLDAANSELCVIFTLRADFYSNLLNHRPISDRLQDTTLNVSALTREELKEVITRPAEMMKLRFQPGLVERILERVEGRTGNLPLLEFALMELWKARDGMVLTHEVYERMGEVDRAIAQHAETVYRSFSDEDQASARRIFLLLVRLAEESNSRDTDKKLIRRRATFSELDAKALPVVRKLADAHLLITGRNDATGKEVVDIIHEALIKSWERLRKWIEDDREFLVWRERNRPFVEDAKEQNYHVDTLLRGDRLRTAKSWGERRWDDLSNEEKQLIVESQKTRFPLIPLFASLMVTILIVATFLWSIETVWIWGSPYQEDNESLAKIQKLIGVTTPPALNDPQAILILGPPPSDAMLSKERRRVITPGNRDLPESSVLEDHSYSLVQCIDYVAAKTEFVFAPVRLDSNFSADLIYVWNVLKQGPNRPRVVLMPDHVSNLQETSRAIYLATEGETVVVMVGPDGLTPSDGQTLVIVGHDQVRFPIDGQIMVVGSVNLEGERSSFSLNGDGLFWAPGENVPLRSRQGFGRAHHTAFSAAIVAGVAVRVLDRSPHLKPSEVIEIIRSKSRANVAHGPPIVNLDEALSGLPR